MSMYIYIYIYMSIYIYIYDIYVYIYIYIYMIYSLNTNSNRLAGAPYKSSGCVSDVNQLSTVISPGCYRHCEVVKDSKVFVGLTVCLKTPVN